MAVDREVILKLNLKPPDPGPMSAALASINSSLDRTAAKSGGFGGKGVGKSVFDLSGAAKAPDVSGPLQAAAAVNASLDAQAKKLKELNAAMDPNTLARRVDLEKKLAAANKDLNKQLEDERRRQWQPESVFGKMSKAMGGGPAKPGSTDSGMGKMLSGIMGEGGAGEAMGLLGEVGAAAGAIAAPVAVAVGAITALGAAAYQLGGKASPGLLLRFNRTMDDTQAVIGARLTPVLDLMTRGMRLLADVMETILPSSQDVADALQPFYESLDDLRDVMKDLAPVMKSFLKEGLKVFALELKLMIPVLTAGVKIMKLLHLGGKDLDVRHAPGSVSFGSSLSDEMKKVYAAAYQSGAGAPNKPEAKIPQIAQDVKKLADWVTGGRASQLAGGMMGGGMSAAVSAQLAAQLGIAGWNPRN